MVSVRHFGLCGCQLWAAPSDDSPPRSAGRTTEANWNARHHAKSILSVFGRFYAISRLMGVSLGYPKTVLIDVRQYLSISSVFMIFDRFRGSRGGLQRIHIIDNIYKYLAEQSVSISADFERFWRFRYF